DDTGAHRHVSSPRQSGRSRDEREFENEPRNADPPTEAAGGAVHRRRPAPSGRRAEAAGGAGRRPGGLWRKVHIPEAGAARRPPRHRKEPKPMNPIRAMRVRPRALPFLIGALALALATGGRASADTCLLSSNAWSFSDQGKGGWIVDG